MTGLLLTIAEISLAMSVMAVILLLLSRLAGARFTARCRYFAWCAVVARLCVPVGAVFMPAFFNVSLPAELPFAETAASPINIVLEAPQDVSPETDFAPEPDNGGAAREPWFEFAVPDTEMLLEITAYIWLAGAAAFMAWKLAAYNRYARRLSAVLITAPESVSRRYASLCAEFGVKRPPELRVSAEAVSPMLIGFFRRRIVLPDLELSDEALDGVLTHELTHHLRGDLWVKFACLFAEALHWFNPAAHLAAERCNAEMELSCDEAVTAGLDDAARLSYGGAMLEIVKRRAGVPGALTTQFNPRASAVRERLRGILDGRKKRRGRLIVAIVALFCAVAGTVVGCGIGAGAAVYERFGLSVPLPGEFEGKVEATPAEQLGDGVVIELYHIGSRKVSAGSGWLFSITRCAADRLVPDDVNPGGTKYFAQGDGWYYALMKPTSLESIPTDAELSAEYERLQDMADEVAADFAAANRLAPFTSADITQSAAEDGGASETAGSSENANNSAPESQKSSDKLDELSGRQSALETELAEMKAAKDELFRSLADSGEREKQLKEKIAELELMLSAKQDEIKALLSEIEKAKK